ncbi:protein kinase domain-containing protein [Gimibacter soli]|uniref:Winged helix-turn-helix domain-containing protein n=1 Tax=Gimibacter soli TaxID=3024400 RepID=A0AAE9XLQ4_9PROT|nr:winged helix-turn-helix domain-containing protein [Gimibacter soli]WCL53247.1 winged helix-turn-helix domain-containing protein [Gimibacter soli]
MVATPDTSGGTLFRYRFGSVEFDEARFELSLDGKPVELERKPLELLAILVAHADEVMTKDELLDHVWAGRITVENVLANAMAKLRKALGPDHADRIVTQARVGYRFKGPVERVATGRRLVNRLDLTAGEQVPGRSHYRLEAQLAGTEGSEVWRARHYKTPETRIFKFSADGAQLSALKREVTLSRILQMSLGDRADIVRIHDWNFEEPPFFLEIEDGGLQLRDWAEEGGRLKHMVPDARLAVAVQIVDAVAAAHRAGVLHKDLKPANILIRENPEKGWQVKLTDFGSGGVFAAETLADLGVTPLGMTQDTGSSETGRSTPLYLAPEVVTGQAPSVRSDIYALGILLYQLLAGDMRKPLTTGWEQDVADELLREDIAAATAGDPVARTPAADMLARSLRDLSLRHRAAEEAREALAQSERMARQLDRLAARRPWIWATGAVLTLGLVASLWLYQGAEKARDQAVAEASRAEAATGFLREVLLAADPRSPGASADASVREALALAADRIDERFGDDPTTQISLHRSIAGIHEGLADFEGAVKHLTRLVSLETARSGKASPESLTARYALAQALSNASRYGEAAPILDAADADAGALIAASNPLAIRAAYARGRYHLLQAQMEPAANAYEQAIAHYDKAGMADLSLLHSLRMDLAQSYSRLGRQEEAVELLEGLDHPAFAEAGVTPARQASAKLFLGAALLYAGRHADAEPVLLSAIDALSAGYGPDSFQAEEARGALVNLYGSTGRWAEALPLITRVREGMCARNGAEHLSCLMQLGNEGVIRLQLGDADGAVPQLAAAREGFAKMMGPASPGVQVMGFHLATAYVANGQAGEAASLLPGLKAPVMEAATPGETWASRIAGLEARVLMRQGKEAEGRAQLEAAVAQMEAEGFDASVIAPYRTDLE